MSSIDIVEQLRSALEGMVANQLEKATGVDRAAICRFVRGERGLTLESAAKLCAYLGLSLLPNRKPKGKS